MIKITAILDRDRTKSASTSWLRVRSLFAIQCRMADFMEQFGANDPIFVDSGDDLASMQWTASVDGTVVRVRLTEDKGSACKRRPSIKSVPDETEDLVRGLIDRVLDSAEVRQVA